MADGVPLDHPDALFWTQITLPDFPAPPARVEIPTIVDGPRGPEFIRQPDYARIGIDDPEGRN